MRPQVDGFFGRYLVAYETTSPSGSAIETARFDWPAMSAPVLGPVRTADVTGSGTSLTLGGLAFTDDTFSHWALAYRIGANDLHVQRLGGTGAPVESVLAVSNPAGITGMAVGVAIAGVFFGLITSAVPYAMARGTRDFSSTLQLVAGRYDVLCDPRNA